MRINYEQILTTIIGGYIGAIIPNNNSNIHPLIMSVIIGSLFSKCIYGGAGVSEMRRYTHFSKDALSDQ